MNSFRTFTLATTIALGTALISGCSFSTSSESSSDSIGSLSDSSGGIFKSASSPFTSSSDSSRNKRDKYETDVADYTATFVVSSSGTLDSFRGHLSELAESHEITNWETDRNTYVGIGRGLAKAKLGKPQISAFTESLSDNEPWKKQAIEEGLKK
ncbi:putative lipoprotein [Methylomonas sp. TEB]|uniref:putative lipoprotein n=1 Tax=Methylomonas sp. TEB TaxID=3398229 RepID=UPI0039F4CCBD|nr:putative lipoprotein [Methylomonas sp. ZR1]